MTSLVLDGSRPSSSNAAAAQPRWPLAVIAFGLSSSAAWGLFLAYQAIVLLGSLAG